MKRKRILIALVITGLSAGIALPAIAQTSNQNANDKATYACDNNNTRVIMKRWAQNTDNAGYFVIVTTKNGDKLAVFSNQKHGSHYYSAKPDEPSEEISPGEWIAEMRRISPNHRAWMRQQPNDCVQVPNED